MSKPSKIIPLEKYDCKEATLLTCISYEERVVKSLERILKKFNIKRCMLIKSVDLDQMKSGGFFDAFEETKTLWNDNYRKINELLDVHNIHKTEIPGSFTRPMALAKNIDKIIGSDKHVAFDISCVPKHIILSILRWCQNKSFTFLYTRPGEYKTAEDEISIGVKEIGVLRGFEGDIRVNYQDLLIILLGFEGGRAAEVFRHYEPYRGIALIGDPSPFYPEEKRKFFIDTCRKNNSPLLSTQRVILHNVSSLNPIRLNDELDQIISEYTKKEPMNVLISHVGTKPQTLGLFVYWKNHQNVQIIYSIPTIRKVSSRDAEATYVYLIDELKK